MNLQLDRAALTGFVSRFQGVVHQRRLPGAAGDVLHHPATVAAQELR